MRRILVALDRSAASSMVLDRAVQLARDTGAKLRLLRAVPLPPSLPPVTAVVPVDGTSAVTAAAEAALRKLETNVPEAMRDGVVIELGSAADAICRAADAYDADVVVIGAHRSGVLRRALGTTATRVVNAIDRPVFLVRAPATASVAAQAGAFKGHDQHPLLETATIAGGVGGAVVGVFGGVPGVVAGSMIGTALGMLAGEKLDEAKARPSEHVRKVEVRGPDGRPLRAGEIMRRDHDLLEELYSDLLSAYEEGDWSDVRAQWSVFEPALRMHMEMEERDVLPVFRGVDAQDADALIAEHDELRKLLNTLGVLIDLHAVPARDAEELVGRLRAHAAHEAALLYPWMDEAVNVDVVHGVSSAA